MFANDTFYPIICTDKLNETVQFYKDHFAFTPLFKEDGFYVLQREGRPCPCLGIIDPSHPAIDEQLLGRTVAGTLISFLVDNVDLAYQQLSWSGVRITKDISKSGCGRRYLLVTDPNGVIIAVTENEQEGRIIKKDRKIPVLSAA